MICCLLALLAAIPGGSFLLRRTLPTSMCHVAVGASGLRRDIGAGVAAAGIVVAVLAVVVTVHRHEQFSLGLDHAPICSAINRILSVEIPKP